jgi:hypothetical protein
MPTLRRPGSTVPWYRVRSWARVERDASERSRVRERTPRDLFARMFPWVIALWGVGIALVVAWPVGRHALARMDHVPGLLVDFGIYHDQVRRLLAPQASLSPHWLYPPLSALLLLGFGPLSGDVARPLWAGIQVLLCVWLMVQCAGRMPGLPRSQRWACALGLVTASLPVAHCVKWGQLSVLVAMLSLIGLRRTGWSGALLLGSAVALKFYPAAYALAPLSLARFSWVLKLMAAVLMLGIGLPAVAFGPEVAGMLLGRALGSATTLASDTSGAYQTLAALLGKWFGTVGDGPLLFAWPPQLLAAASSCAGAACLIVTLVVCRRRSGSQALTASEQLRAQVPIVPRSDQPIDVADVVSIMLCGALLLRPAWMHYFVMLPVGHAILLERSRGRRTQQALLTGSFALSAGSLSACLYEPALFAIVQQTGLLTLSGLLCLTGLWFCERDRDGVGYAA